MKFLATLLFTLMPSFVLGQAFIERASSEGPTCPPGSWAWSVDSGDRHAGTIGLDQWTVEVSDRNDVPPSKRDMDCTLTFYINYPAGCTQLSINNTYHGFMSLDTQGDLLAKVTRAYTHTSGQVNPNTPPELVFNGSGFENGQDFYYRHETTEARIQVTSESQRTLEYTIRMRAHLQSPSQRGYAKWSLEDVGIGLHNQRRC